MKPLRSSWKQNVRRVGRKIFLRDQSLIVKLFVFSALLVVIPMLIVGVISYHRSAHVLEEEAKQYSMQIMEQVKMYIEDYLRDFEISTLKIINHPDTVAFLKMKSAKEVERSGIKKSVSNVLKNAAYSRPTS